MASQGVARRWRPVRVDPRALATALTGAATTLPAQAIVVDQGAVARTLVLVFLGFAVLLLFVVLAGVALVAGATNRRARLPSALAWFGAAAAATTIVLLVLSGSLSFAQLERAMLYGAVFLILVAVTLIARAFVAARPK